MNDLIAELVQTAEREAVQASEDSTPAGQLPRLLELAKNPEALGHSLEKSVLLSGFTSLGRRNLGRLFLEESWNLYIASNQQGIERAVSTCKFGLILVDVDNINEYGPSVIHALRCQEVPKHRAHIIAVSKFFVPSFADQLLTSGVDELLSITAKSQPLALEI